jgi:predicted nucleotidyltransferase
MPRGSTPKTRIPLPLDEIAALCRKYDVTELSVFGSVLRDDFGPDSDVDFLVTFRNNDAGPWMPKFMYMEADLSALLGRPVDVVDRRGVMPRRNPIRRRSILSNAKATYDGA